MCVCVCVCLVAGQNQATCDGMDDMIERFTAQLSCTKTPACNRADCTPTNVLLTGYSLSIELLSCRTPPGMILTLRCMCLLSIMMNVLLGVCIKTAKHPPLVYCGLLIDYALIGRTLSGEKKPALPTATSLFCYQSLLTASSRFYRIFRDLSGFYFFEYRLTGRETQKRKHPLHRPLLVDAQLLIQTTDDVASVG